jgi:tetratricopeptide (TPR) repeat protein
MADQQQNMEEWWSGIERYLQDRMSPEERLAFENNINANPELKAEFALHRSMHTILGNPAERTYRTTLQQTSSQWHERNLVSKRREILPVRTILSIAAALLVIIMVFAWFDREDSTDVFAQNFEPYTMILTERAIGDTARTAKLLSQAIAHYNSGRFENAANTFTQLRNAGMDEVTIQFYEAVSLLESGKHNEATQLLQDLIERPDHLLKEQSRWYLGLALWQNGSIEEARKVFQSIKPGKYHYEKAAKIVRLRK